MTATCCERMAYDLNHTCPDHANRYDCPDAFIDRTKEGFGLIVHGRRHVHNSNLVLPVVRNKNFKLTHYRSLDWLDSGPIDLNRSQA
jgi:hypothetical protein